MLWISIARLTWLELWQNRTYKVLLVIALCSPFFAMTFSALFMVDIGKVYVDVVAGFSQFLAILFMVFLVVTLLSRDIFDRVCYMLLAPPMNREYYFIGRFAGVSAAFFVLLMSLLCSSAFGGLLYIEPKAEIYQTGFEWFLLAQLMYFYFFQYISILGLIFFIVSWSSGDAETMVFTVAVLVMAWVFPPVLKAMQNPDVSSQTPQVIVNMLQVIYELMPHLQGSDIVLALTHGQHISFTETLFYTLEHLLYAIVFFVLGLLVFKRRDL